MSDYDAIRPVTVREAVYSRIQRMLIDREYQPGDHLVETELADRLGVSRGPVREALQQLEREGWVDVRPRHGAYVHAPSVEEAAAFFEVRTLLEREAARLAAVRGMESAEEKLLSIVRKAESAIQGDGSTASLADLTAAFHGAVSELSGNPFLDELVRGASSRTRWYFRPLVERISEQAWREHRQIAEAIARGDSETAASLMESHIQWSRRTYIDHASGDGRS